MAVKKRAGRLKVLGPIHSRKLKAGTSEKDDFQVSSDQNLGWLFLY